MPKETQRERRGHDFYPPTDAAVPALYAQDGKGMAAVVKVHYFAPATGADWFVTEYDPETGEAFGWAEILPGCGELGYTDLAELEAVAIPPLGWVVERDCHWVPVTLSEAVAARYGIVHA